MLRLMCLVLLALANPASAAPPSLEIPNEVVPNGDYAVLVPKTDAVSVTYVGLSGVDAFPSEFLKDPRSFVLPTRGLPKGAYKFAAVGASNTGEQSRKDFVVSVGGGTNPPPTEPTDPTDPPPDPTPNQITFFAVIRADGPADASFTKIMTSPAWETIKSGGYQFKDYTVSEAAARGIAKPNVLPAVVTLRYLPTDQKSKIIRGPIPLPTTADGIAKLPVGLP